MCSYMYNFSFLISIFCCTINNYPIQEHRFLLLKTFFQPLQLMFLEFKDEKFSWNTCTSIWSKTYWGFIRKTSENFINSHQKSASLIFSTLMTLCIIIFSSFIKSSNFEIHFKYMHVVDFLKKNTQVLENA